MPEYLTPDVYVEEVAGGPRPIQAVGTRTAGFIGEAPKADVDRGKAIAINNWSEFMRRFVDKDSKSTALSNAVFGFFLNGGSRCFVVNVGRRGAIDAGLRAFEAEDEIAMVAAPGYADAGSHDALLTHCEQLMDRVAILDAAIDITDIGVFQQAETAGGKPKEGEKPPAHPRLSKGGYGALYFPGITVRDALTGELVDIAPSGHVAGIWARSDASRGVHKAPANEVVRGALNVTYRLTREEQGVLNPVGVNCIRYFPRGGIMLWGARTLDEAASEWRYLNVRRLFNMIEESIAEATRWIVFEPNEYQLWKSVKCDDETNPPDVIDAGMVVAIIGIAPVKPAEFVVFRISQHAGGVEIEAEGGARG